MSKIKNKINKFLLFVFTLLNFFIVPTVLYAQEGIIATPTTSRIILDGNEIHLQAYNIEDNNYFKLRDLAFVLKESEKKFDLYWNIWTEGIVINTKSEYKPLGDELTKENDENKVAYKSNQEVSIDGLLFNLSVYNINDYNYFKLREIAYALDFNIEWSEGENGIYINTNSQYKFEDYTPTITKDNSTAIGEVYEAGLATFIDEMPIIAYKIQTQDFDISEKQIMTYKKYPDLADIYFIAEDLHKYGFDEWYEKDESTLYIWSNPSKQFGMMDGLIVNSKIKKEKQYDLYKNNKYVMFENKKVASYSIGEKSLIAATELLDYCDINTSVFNAQGGDKSGSLRMGISFDMYRKRLDNELNSFNYPTIKMGDYGQTIIKGSLINDKKEDLTYCKEPIGLNSSYSVYVGYYESDIKSGSGIFYTHGIYDGNGRFWLRNSLQIQIGRFEGDKLVTGVSYRSPSMGGTGNYFDGYRLEGNMDNGYLRKSVVTPYFKGRFGYAIQCEGEVENGEFCGYYRSYDYFGELIFEGDYNEYLKTLDTSIAE